RLHGRLLPATSEARPRRIALPAGCRAGRNRRPPLAARLGAAVMVLERGPALRELHGLVAVEYPAKVHARTRRGTHQAVDGFTKRRQAVDRTFENRSVERSENGDDIPGHPGAQLGTEQARPRAVSGGSGDMRRRIPLTAESRAGCRRRPDLPFRRRPVAAIPPERADALDDV